MTPFKAHQPIAIFHALCSANCARPRLRVSFRSESSACSVRKESVCIDSKSPGESHRLCVLWCILFLIWFKLFALSTLQPRGGEAQDGIEGAKQVWGPLRVSNQFNAFTLVLSMLLGSVRGLPAHLFPWFFMLLLGAKQCRLTAGPAGTLQAPPYTPLPSRCLEERWDGRLHFWMCRRLRAVPRAEQLSPHCPALGTHVVKAKFVYFASPVSGFNVRNLETWMSLGCCFLIC